MRATRGDKEIVLTYEDIKEGRLSNFIKEAIPGEVIGDPTKACNFIKALSVEDPGVEKMWIIFLNVKNKVIAIEVVGSGTVSTAPVYPREVVKKIIKHSASAIIMAHNHPSGDTEPSREDDNITRTLYFAAMIVGCQVHDHLIVGDGANGYYSYSNTGKMDSFKNEYEKLF